jgi:hypothetical protein
LKIKRNYEMDTPVIILTLENEIKAILLDEILTEKEIPHILRSYRDFVYDGLWQTQSSWGHIEAPEEYRNEIIQIYNELSA